jgi:hypothetical protein
MNVRILLAVLAMSLAACTGEEPAQSRGPIILGDSSTIVTETDPEALRDLVPDLQPVIHTEQTAGQELAAPPADTATRPAEAAKPQPGDGLTVAFKEVTLFIPGIKTRSYGRADLQKARSATYELTDGKLAGARMQASGGTVSKVSQRYETMIVLKHGSEQLPLESLGKYTSAWQALRESGNAYAIAGLEPSKLGFKQVSATAIRNAVQQAARKQRLNRKETQEWTAAARNVRSASQAPADVILRSVSWRVEGKDAAGKAFTKELRIDMPAL